MKTVSAEQIAQALGLSERSVLRRAATEAWAYEIAPGKGSPRVYPRPRLPQDVRQALDAADVARWQAQLKLDLPAPAVAATAAPQALDARGLKRRDLKIAIFEAYEGFRLAHGYADRQAWPMFAGLYLHAARLAARGQRIAGPVELAQLDTGVYRDHPRMSAATLRRICETARKGAINALGGKQTSRKGTGVLDRANGGEVAAAVLAIVTMQPKLSAGAIRDQVRARFGSHLDVDGRAVPLPPLRTVQHFVAQMKVDKAGLIERETNPDAWKARRRFAFGAQPTGEGLNDVWLIDASPADALLAAGHGMPAGRYSVYALLDLFSRRLMIAVTRTPKAEAVLALLRRGLLEWGVPNEIRTDNGSDFKAVRVAGTLAALGIRAHAVRAYSPELKAHVERAIGTFQRGLMPLLPGFVGHSVADAQAIRSRRTFAERLGESDANAFCAEIDAAELQTRADEWCAVAYGHAPHGGLDGKAPSQVAIEWTGAIKRIADPRALDLLLCEPAEGQGLRTVTKKGIRVENATFWGPGLEPGMRVRVRLDAADMGRIHVYTAHDDAFVCVAECPERLGTDRAAMAARARADQAQRIAEDRAQIRRTKAGRTFKSSLYEAARDAARLDVPGNVVALPKPVETHSTPALDAASEAADALAGVPAPAVRAAAQVPAPTLAQAAPRRPVEIVDLSSQRRTQAERQGQERAARLARAQALHDRIAAGELVDPAERAWWASYAQGAEWSTHLRVQKAIRDGLVVGAAPAAGAAG